MSKVRVTFAPRTGCPPLVIRSANESGAAARLGETSSSRLVASAGHRPSHRAGTDPGQGRVLEREGGRRRRQARQHRGGEHHAHDHDHLAATSAAQQPGRRLAELGALAGGDQPGPRAQQVAGGDQQRRAEQSGLDQDRLRRSRSATARRRRADGRPPRRARSRPAPVPSRTPRPKTAARHRQRRHAIPALGSENHSTSRPTSPPSHTDPAARWSQSNATSARAERSAPRGPRRPERPAPRSPPAARRSAATSSAIERRSRSGGRPTARPRPRGRTARSTARGRRIARPNAVTPNSGTSAPTSNTERSESLAVEKSRYTGIAISPTTEAITNAIESARRLTPGTRLTTGRTIRIRSTNSPIAAITATNISQRVISSCGVVARRRDARDLELGRRSRVRAHRVGERPRNRMAVDRDRPPVDQVPALREVGPQRHDQRVRVGRRAADRSGRLLPAGGVGHRDDREPWLDRLVVGELDGRGRSVQHLAGRRHRLDQVGVRRRRRRAASATPRPRPARRRSGAPELHASARSLEPRRSAQTRRPAAPARR